MRSPQSRKIKIHPENKRTRVEITSFYSNHGPGIDTYTSVDIYLYSCGHVCRMDHWQLCCNCQGASSYGCSVCKAVANKG